MILTTTPNIEGREIVQYLGLVTVELEMVYNEMGHHPPTLDDCTATLTEQAETINADAVVGITIAGQGSSYHRTIHILGTAVKLK